MEKHSVLSFGAVLLFLLAVSGMAAVAFYGTHQIDSPREYAIVIDAGSSHSQFFVYSWLPTAFNTSTEVSEVPDVNQEPFACGTKPGISSFTDPLDAAESLHDCMRKAVDVIPEKSRKKTSVHLRATAGMRVLFRNNKMLAKQILSACVNLFESFDVHSSACSAEILSGKEEGAFGWITANYVDHHIDPHPADTNTTGALDLGGASTQITFSVKNASVIKNATDLFSLTLFDRTFELYAHSYLCYGSNAALERTRALLLTQQPTPKAPTNETLSHPCLPTGYNETLSHNDISFLRTDFCGKPYNVSTEITGATYTGASNTTSCSATARALVTATPYPPVGKDQPSIPASPFFAFSGYYYAIDYFCGVRNATGCGATQNGGWSLALQDLAAITNTVCSEDLDDLRKNSPGVADKYLIGYCFQGHYITSMLETGYGFSSATERIEFVGTVNGTDVGWTLGYLLWDTTNQAGKPKVFELRGSSMTVAVVLVVVVALCGIVLVHCARTHRKHRSGYARIGGTGSSSAPPSGISRVPVNTFSSA